MRKYREDLKAGVRIKRPQAPDPKVYNPDGTVYLLTAYGRVLIDADSLLLIGQHKLCLRLGYPTLRLGKQIVPLHRLVNKTPVGMSTDHINGNRLDNRKVNLRTCNHSQNQMNRGVSKANTSGHSGICWDKRDGKWQASIRVNRRRTYLGLFKSKRAAVAARKAAEKKYFGEFVREVI